MFAAALPEVAPPYCLKGDTLAALRRFEDADSAYTEAMENLDRPVYPDPQTAGVRETMARLMSRTLYLNRGNVRAAAGNHKGAVADFDVALQQGYDPKRTVLYNRGNSKSELEMFEEAHADFEAAWSEEEKSDAALAMGNCKVMMGAFEHALQRYMNGSAMEPEGTAAHCRSNAEQIQQILRMLDGREYQVSRWGDMVYVETTVGLGKLFPFVGNKGNSGNVPSGMVTAPGGEGYEGMAGFCVTIASPAS